MKSLVKILLLPLAISSIISLDSKAQDFLPGKFKNYRDKPATLLEKEDSLYLESIKKYTNMYCFDIDKDDSLDVIEFYLWQEDENGQPKLSKNPYYYLLFLNGESELPTCILDFYGDGLDDKDKIINDEEKIDPSKFNL